MGFDAVEKNTLYQKFKLIEQMLILDYNMRVSYGKIVKYNSLEELKKLRDENFSRLSNVQTNWLYNSINRH